MPRTDSVVNPRIDGDPEFCPDAICTTHEQWIGVACRLEVKDASKSANLSISTRTARRTHVWFDRFDKCVSSIDRDPCLCISEARNGRSRRCPRYCFQPSLQ